MARGRYPESEADDPGSAAGDDPLAAWRVARADMMAPLDPAALARRVPGPWRQTPLGEILERSAMEFLVHTWDVAQATGQPAVLDPGLVHGALDRPGSSPRRPGRQDWLAPDAPCRRTPTISLDCWRFAAAVTPKARGMASELTGLHQEVRLLEAVGAPRRG